MPEVPDDPRLVENAREVLSDALEWKLTDSRWNSADKILGRMILALDTDDVAAFRRAEIDFEEASPNRVVPMKGGPPEIPAPERIRLRINHLIHRLGGTPDAGAPPPAARGGGA